MLLLFVVVCYILESDARVIRNSTSLHVAKKGNKNKNAKARRVWGHRERKKCEVSQGQERE